MLLGGMGLSIIMGTGALMHAPPNKWVIRDVIRGMGVASAHG